MATANIHLHRFAVLTAGATFLLIIAGALVTSHDAGLAVPDWPLSYGSLMPPMVGNIVYEHGHRLVAAFVGLLTTILALWLLVKEPRAWVRRLGLAALAAVVAQGILGGITVLFLLPLPVSIAHASLAQVFFCLAMSLALFTSPNWREVEPKAEDSGVPRLQHLCVATTLAIFVQLVLGAALRHAAVGVVPHLVGAAVASGCVGWTLKRVRQRHTGQPRLWRPALGLGGLLTLQLLLGAGAYFIRAATAGAVQPQPAMLALTVAHVAGGALTLAASVVLTLQSYRCLAAPRQPITLGSTTQRATV